MSSGVTFLSIEADGTVAPVPRGDAPAEYRRCATDNRGDPAGLLAEMRSRKPPLPWLDQAARDVAAAVVRELPGLTARTRAALLRHVGATPYAQRASRGVLFTFVDGSPRFAHGRAARTLPAWGPFLDLRAECAAGADPIPYASKEIRDTQAARIRTDTEARLSDDERAALLAHVARTPYLAVGSEVRRSP